MLTRNIFLACILAVALPALAGPRYTVTALPSGTNPTGINSAGQIVGDLVTDEGRRGFVWSQAGLVELGTLGGWDSTALAINSSGLVTGYASVANGDTQAFTYAGGALTELHVLNSSNSFGIAINDNGQVAGQYIDTAQTYRAFIHSNGVATDLGTLGGNFAYAAGINQLGHVVGGSALDDETPYLSHAFLYRDGVMTDLGTLGGSYSVATAINDLGQVTGNAWVDGSEHAFLYSDGVMVDLGTLGGRYSFANGINERGQVVGYSNDPDDFDFLAFLYDAGVMTDLNTLIDPALGWKLYAATAINDKQQIAAFGCRGDDCGGVLLELASPVPEPTTLGMMAAGLGLLGLRRFSASCRRG